MKIVFAWLGLLKIQLGSYVYHFSLVYLFIVSYCDITARKAKNVVNHFTQIGFKTKLFNITLPT